MGPIFAIKTAMDSCSLIVRPGICNCLFPCGSLYRFARQPNLPFRTVAVAMIYAWESYDILLQASETVLCRIPRHAAANLVGFCSPFYTILRSLKTEPTIRPKNGPLKLNCVSGAKFVVPYFGANFPPRMWADIAQTFEQGQRKIGSRNAAKLVARARSDKSSLKLFWRFRMLLLKYIAACHCVQLWWSTSQHIYATGTRTHSEGTRMQGIFVRKKGYHFARQTRGRCPCQRIKGSSPGFAFNMCGHARHAQGNWKCAPSRLHAYLVCGRCLASSEHLRNAQKAYTYKMRSETPFGRRPEIQCYLICEDWGQKLCIVEQAVFLTPFGNYFVRSKRCGGPAHRNAGPLRARP